MRRRWSWPSTRRTGSPRWRASRSRELRRREVRGLRRRPVDPPRHRPVPAPSRRAGGGRRSSSTTSRTSSGRSRSRPGWRSSPSRPWRARSPPARSWPSGSIAGPGRRLTRPLAIIHRRSHQLGLTASRFLELLTCEAHGAERRRRRGRAMIAGRARGGGRRTRRPSDVDRVGPRIGNGQINRNLMPV